jgi:hypothetical protein
MQILATYMLQNIFRQLPITSYQIVKTEFKRNVFIRPLATMW